MRRIPLTLTALVAVLLVAGPAGAQSSDTTSVTLIHGFRGLLADVYLDGERILEGFAPERSTDPTELPSGEHTVAVREADAEPDSTPVVEATLDLPAGATLSAVVHPDSEGEPTVSVFDNDFDDAGDSRARAVVRHTAVAPAINVAVGDVEVASALEPGEEADAVIQPSDTDVTTTEADSADTLLPPGQINAAEGTTVALYLIGSADDDSLGWLSERLAGADSAAPVGVPTGNAGLAAPVGVPSWAAAAAILAILAVVQLARISGRLRHVTGA